MSIWDPEIRRTGIEQDKEVLLADAVQWQWKAAVSGTYSGQGSLHDALHASQIGTGNGRRRVAGGGVI